MSAGSYASGWVDYVLLAILLISVCVGLWRGLLLEVLSLIAWVVAYFAAQWLAPSVASWIPLGTPGGGLRHGAAFALTFVAALVLWMLLARLLRMVIHSTPLQVLDRVLGAGFGLLRGAVLLLALATVVSLTPAVRSPAWQDSQGAQWLGIVLQGLKPALPDALARHLPA